MTDKPQPNVRIFAVKTRFQEMARRPGGVPRELAIQQADSQIEDFRTEYVDWIDLELQELMRALRAVEGGQADDMQIEPIYRRCRQLRDTGTTMGLSLVSFISDNLCKVLDTVKAGAPYDAEVIKCHMDALSLAKKEGYRKMSPEQVPEMTSGLHRMLERANRGLPGKAG